MTVEWKEALRFFLHQYVPRHRGMSPATRGIYATGLKFFTGFLKRRHPGIPPPCEVGFQTVFDYLNWLEKDRKNSAATRNSRLAALKSFWEALRILDPGCAEKYDRLMAIPFKRFRRRTPDYLELDELRAIFDRIDPATPIGFRDLVLLRFMYNTGARISEVCDARLSHLRLDERREILIRGKGGKLRVCPLWQTTAELLKIYLRRERPEPKPGFEDFLFVSFHFRKAFTRKGLWKILRGRFDRAAEHFPALNRKRITPHSMRHTTAVHLLRSGVDIYVIKAWLGHRDVETTAQYLDLDLDKKREALEKFSKLDAFRLPPGTMQMERGLEENFLKWLDSI